MARRLARLLLLLAPLLAPLWAPLWALPAAAAERMADQAVAALNAARTVRGLAPVQARPELMDGAQAHAADMASRGYVGLDPPGDVTFRDWLQRAGYLPGSSRVMMTTGYPDAGLMVEGLLGEHGFSDALLDPDIGEIGVGHSPGPYRSDDGIVTHAWIMVLARTRYAPVPNAAERLAAAVNAARRQRGLSPVTPSVRLSAAAAAHAEDMVARGYFAHLSPDGERLGDRVLRQRFPYRRVGENLAAGQDTAEAVVAGWADSPGHAATMFDPSFREIGIGYQPGPVVEPERSYGHVWVAVFGDRR